MQLTIQATGENVQMLSYLLAKNPNNLYERNENGHLVRMFYSRFEEEHVDVTFFVTPDPIELSRNNAGQYDITSYINDREFAVSSIFCSLLRTALGTALNGKPKEEYSEWVTHSFPLSLQVGPIASPLSDTAIEELFEPLGFDVDIIYGNNDYELDLKTKSSARFLRLSGSTPLQMALRQLYVLIPVLDNYKHYFIDEKEVEKIKRYGEGWLETHPQREYILKQALRFKEVYRLVEKQDETETTTEDVAPHVPKQRLNELRYEAIIQTIEQLPRRKTIVDLGAGEGKLSVRLGLVDGVQEILAVEPAEREVIKALKRYEAHETNSAFVKPTQLYGSLFYYDERLTGKDIIILCEVIEHIDESRLPKVMETLLGINRPDTLIVTTPNREFNIVYGLDESYRHPDHRFEWDRTEFQAWCNHHAEKSGYVCRFEGIGEMDNQVGQPTQMCIFSRKEGA